MKRGSKNVLFILSVPAVSLHIVSLFIVTAGSIGFFGILISLMLLLALNITAWRLESRIVRRLSRENDYASWETRHESADVIAEKNLEQERKIHKTYHDIYNHISVAAAMLGEGDTEGAADYLEKLSMQIRSKK